MRGAIAVIAAAVVEAYTVEHVDVTVGGYVCGEHQTARVYHPDVSNWYVRLHGKFPLIAFAHGFNNPGTEAYSSYTDLITSVAAAGYVVIVSESSAFPFECPSEWKDQKRSLEWAKSSNFTNRIDFTKTGILGHSMGAGATYHLAGLASAVEDLNIGAAVALHPQITSPLPIQPITNSVVPIFFGTGSADSVVSPASVKSAYDKTVNVSKVFAEISGAVHNEPMVQPWGHGRFTPYVIAMFDCHLKGIHWKWDGGGCAQIYGSGSDSLCGGAVNMTDCEFANGPQSTVVMV